MHIALCASDLDFTSLSLSMCRPLSTSVSVLEVSLIYIKIHTKSSTLFGFELCPGYYYGDTYSATVLNTETLQMKCILLCCSDSLSMFLLYHAVQMAFKN